LFNNSDLVNNVPVPPFGGQVNFTQPPGAATSGFWDFFPDRRTSAYAVDIIGAATAFAPSVSSPSTLPFAIGGVAYTAALMVQSAPGVSYTWTASGLPPGLTISPGGVVSGTPSAPGTYSFTVVANDGVESVQQTETITVYGVLAITTLSLPVGTRGERYGPIQLTASGGSGEVTWSSNGLVGLSLTPTGILSGTVPAFVPSFTVTATDLVTGQTATMTYSISFLVAPLTVTGGGALPEVAAGAAISALFSASGGTPPYVFTAANLPAGLSLGSSTGLLSGTVSSPGNFPFTVSVSDSAGQSTVIPASVAVLGLVSGALPVASLNTPYSFLFSVAGGTGRYTYSATNLPAGLTLSTAGLLSGTPKNAGSTTFSIQVSDGVVTASATITLVIHGGSSTLSAPGGTLSGGTLQQFYSATLTATGGSAPYSWMLTGGSLPTGLSLSASGQLSGTPSTPGSFTFTLQVTDAAGATASASYTIVIGALPLALLTGNSLPNDIVGSPYPLQIFSASGGVPPYTFTISSGALPPGLSFMNGEISGTPTTPGTYPITLTVTDSTKETLNVSLSIAIDPTQPDLILSDTYLSFAVTTGSTGLPSADNVTVRSSEVQVVLGYTYTMTPAVSWLSVSGGTITPGSLVIGLTNAALSQAAATTPYTTKLTVTCAASSPCAGHTQTISVSLTVSAPPAQLGVTSQLLAFHSTTATPSPSSLPLGIENTGGGILAISSITAANSWVTISGAPTSVAAGTAAAATITVNPSALPAGYNSSSVTVNSDGGSVTVPVTLNISKTTIMTLSPAAGQFSLPAGGALSPAMGSFQVSVNGTGTVSWKARVLPGAAFLSTSTPTGSSTSASAGTVNYAIDTDLASQLPAGTYYGTVEVSSSSVTDSPLDYQISLTVNVSGSQPVPIPLPAGLLFETGAATSQPVSVDTSSTQTVNYQASAATTDGANWLSVSPVIGSASALSPGASTVSVTTAGLAQGVYTGLVSYALSAAAVRSVNVTLVVTEAGAAAVADVTTCTPKQLVATQIGLVDNFSLLAGLPVGLQVLVIDDCGNPIPNGQVTATFSNGDSPLTLAPVDTVSGIYAGTWTPLGVSPQVSVTSVATMSGLLPGTTRINGLVAGSSAPVLTQNAVVSIYNPLIGGAIAPGAIVELFGSNLAAAAVSASKTPFPATLGSTSVTIGGIQAPLYYVSPTQINAQAPFELVPGNEYEVVVNANGALAAPGTISVESAEPGIASYPNGQIIAQHVDETLVSEESPAIAGTYIVFYLAGLGATDTPVADGAASPTSPLAHPLVQPTLTLNGVTQPYQFVGLTPGSVGLYQINFLVPAVSSDGDMKLVISQSGVESNTVILPVHQ
jgi:uncharacterized protein (TIGR03437 family)